MQIEGGRGAILFREECPSHFVYLGGWFGWNVFVFRQFLVCCLGGMNMFSGRKTVGAYRIRPDVREVFAALLGECSGLVCVVRSREGVCDTPLRFLADCVGWLVMRWFRFRPCEGVCDTPLHFLADCVGWLVVVGLYGSLT